MATFDPWLNENPRADPRKIGSNDNAGGNTNHGKVHQDFFPFLHFSGTHRADFMSLTATFYVQLMQLGLRK
jgi:hypothetical protein